MWRSLLAVVFLVLTARSTITSAFSDIIPHHYTSGFLKPFSGLPLPYSLTAYEKKLLGKGKPVIMRDEGVTTLTGKDKIKVSGRAMIIQDIAAPPSFCIEKMLDFDNYTKMVSLLKKFDIYEKTKLNNGTEITCAKYEVGLFYLRLGYFLKQKYSPQYNSLTWTLDYSRDSDFDDNVGHWQVMSHPHKMNWSRVLYSTEALLPEWLPSFALKFVEKAALTESTGWLKREAEKAFKEASKRTSGGTGTGKPPNTFTDVPHIYTDDPVSGGAQYTPLATPADSCEEAGAALSSGQVDRPAGGDEDDLLKQSLGTVKVIAGNVLEMSGKHQSSSFEGGGKFNKMLLPSMTILMKKQKISKIRIKHILP